MSSLTAEIIRTLPNTGNDFDAVSNSPKSPVRTAGGGGPIVSFADFLAETGSDEVASNDGKQSNEELNTLSLQQPSLHSNPDP